ncbi:MAG: hypothetical protein HY903_25045 [Deltaproteobacteria bacterium]|nr:hypothetical protein [Deltaproteobacteria bacterium]
MKSKPGALALSLILTASSVASMLGVAACGGDRPRQGGAGDGGAGGDAAGGDTSASAPRWLSNAGFTEPPKSIAPDPGEEGYLAAARLTPPYYPFTVTRISYRLVHGSSAGGAACDALAAHRVEVSSSTAIVPAASPSPVVLTEPQGSASDVIDVVRDVDRDLPAPLTLTPGEHLFVAVALTGTYPNVMCIGINSDDPFDADRNYWSRAAAAPYDWTSLSTFNLDGSLLLSARGQ